MDIIKEQTGFLRNKELSDLIRNQIKDPRLPDFVSVTAVRVTKDLRYAKAYISVLGDDDKRKGAIEALSVLQAIFVMK